MVSKEKKAPEQYKKKCSLGKGAFGQAYLVQGQTSGLDLVIKEIDLNEMEESDQKDALKEAKVMQMLHHPNIVKFYDVYKTKKKKLCIVMEYADGGDLNKIIKQKKKQLKETGDTAVYFPEDDIMRIFASICDAIGLMHNREKLGKRIIHRDIKSHNIFLMKDGAVKLGDFGIARILEHTKSRALSVIGTPYYFSPEMCKGEEYDEMTDIWSLGILLYEMCQLEYPFKGKCMSDLTNAIISQKQKAIPEIYSRELKDIINGLLKKDPKKRPNISQILKHPKIKAALQKQQNTTQSEATVIEQQDTAGNDDDREDDDDVGEGESTSGTTRDIEFDVDPLQKLPPEEFVLEVQKTCGQQAADAWHLLNNNKDVCYMDESERGKAIEDLLATNGITIEQVEWFIVQVPSYIIMQNMKL